MESEKQKKREKGCNFSDGEIAELISLYGARKDKLEKMSAKKPIYEEIAAVLNEKFGNNRTWDTVKRKINKLCLQYRDEKPGPTGGKPSKWLHYDALHKILHEKPAYNNDLARTNEVGISDDEGDVEQNGQQGGDETSEISIELTDTNEPQSFSDEIENDENVPPKKKKRKLTKGGANSSVIAIAEETLSFLKKDAEKRDKVREEISSTNTAMVEQLKRIADSSEGLVRAILAQNSTVVVELDADGNLM